jgi:Ran GTPase-activating protein (RanGAP) involved in mRNA processing and transport
LWGWAGLFEIYGAIGFNSINPPLQIDDLQLEIKMPDSPLHCPQPQPIETTPDVLNDLIPLLEYLATNSHVADRITFPRGTLMPDGRLDMCKQNLGVTGCELVAQALETDRTISSLLLGTNGIGDIGVKSIAKLITRNDNLEVVYLGCNAISGAGIETLSNSLIDNSTVIGLWLKRNPIGVDGAEHIAKMLHSNTSIQTLDLVHTRIGKVGLKAIVDVLIKTNRTVKRLYLGGNDLDPDDAYLIANLLKSNSSIEALLLNVNYLGDRGIEILADALAINTSITELGLASNGITDRGCKILMTAIESMPNLTRLDLGYSPSTKILGAPPNSITESGIVDIANYLATNRTLSHLNLSRVKLVDRSQSLFADALTTNRTLSHLTISGKLSPQITIMLDRNRSYLDSLLTPIDRLHQSSRTGVSSIRSVYR